MWREVSVIMVYFLEIAKYRWYGALYVIVLNRPPQRHSLGLWPP